MGKQNVLITSLVAVLLTAVSSDAISGKGKGNGNGEGKGNVAPYTVSLTALQDVTGTTDATIQVNVVEPGFSAPTLAKKIQTKSLDANGEAVWTQNKKNVSLTPNNAGTASIAGMQYSDLDPGKPLQTRLLIQNDETGDTEVVDTSMVVQRRPDLSVTGITTADQINPNIVTNISVQVEELNGELSADSNVVLLIDGVEVDRTNNVSVNPNGNVTVLFAHTFSAPGSYEMTVSAIDVNPGDYDLSNNTDGQTVIVEDLPSSGISTYAYMGYYRDTQDSTYTVDYDYYYSDYQYEYSGTSQSLYAGLYEYNGYYNSQDTISNLQFPINMDVAVRINGQPSPDHTHSLTIDADYETTYSDYCGAGQDYRYGYGYEDLGDGRYAYAYIEDYCGSYTYGYVEYSQYASDYVYRSQNFIGTWNVAPISVVQGTIIEADAGDSVEVDLLASSQSGGDTYGGTIGPAIITSYPIDYESTYCYSYYCSTSSGEGESWSASWDGMTQ